jgi:hypothetical protein
MAFTALAKPVSCGMTISDGVGICWHPSNVIRGSGRDEMTERILACVCS